MKHERATEGTRQQSALYALGLLTQHEAHCFELHIEECSVCREEFARLLLTAAQIGLAVKEEEPPEGFRERLAARIDSSTRPGLVSDSPQKQVSAPRPAHKEPAKTFKPEKKAAPASKNAFVPANAPGLTEQPRSGKTAFVIHAVVYVLLAAFTAFSFYSWQTAEKEKSRLHSRIDSAEDNASDLKWRLDQMSPQLVNAERLERFQEMFRKPSVRVARLKGQPLTPDNTGIVVWDGLTGDIMVVGRFAPAPAGKVYQLWFFVSSERISVGTLTSDRNGYISTIIRFNQSMTETSGITAIATLESAEDLPVLTAPAGPWSAGGRVE